MTTKSKKSRKKTSPEGKPNTIDRQEQQTPPETLPPEDLGAGGDPPSSSSHPDELGAGGGMPPMPIGFPDELRSESSFLLELAIDYWMGTMMKPLLYHLTRTFAHHSVGETYGTVHLFPRFKALPKGCENLLRKMMSFKETILREWEEHPEGRIIRVGKPGKKH